MITRTQLAHTLGRRVSRGEFERLTTRYEIYTVPSRRRGRSIQITLADCPRRRRKKGVPS